MASVAANTRVAVTGGVFAAVTGTTLPTDATAALDAAFKDLGYIHEDGIDQSIDESHERLRAWQNSETVRLLRTTHDVMYALQMIETNPDTLATYYGNYDAKTGGGTEVVELDASVGVTRSWVFNIVDGATKGRLVIPSGQIIERGDVTYKNDDAIGYPIKIECLPVAGVKAYLYGLIPA